MPCVENHAVQNVWDSEDGNSLLNSSFITEQKQQIKNSKGKKEYLYPCQCVCTYFYVCERARACLDKKGQIPTTAGN